jgi:acetyl-CoA carboxylase biotin carboxylase subunit
MGNRFPTVVFDKVLIANRGEIAVRVIRACRELGVATVAVHSEADEGAPFTRLADEAVPLGGFAPGESYLVQEKIIEAAHETGAEAVHPGYGFLSENPDFSRAVTDAGLVFVGPTGDAMEAVGDKVQARETAQTVDVPVSAGSEGGVSTAKDAERVARDIGFPVLLKSAAGGGGMGMRRVDEPDELEPAFKEASQQAESAFGDGRLFVEKFHERPRHVEIQLLGLEDGAVHLGERECSIQRRYQKLVEEAPSPAVDEDLREEMGAAACRLADEVGYRNAGTAEFLLTEEGFFFNEVNARLQVEHTVTELVTGIDVVKAQLRIAAGEDPGIEQEEVEMRGHGLELRVNAEDPLHDFRPTPGTLEAYEEPKGPFVRVDSGIEAGGAIRQEYDSLIAKLITWGQDREESCARARAALRDFHVDGVETTIPFHLAVLQEEHFLAGDLSTTYLDEVPVLETVKDAAEDAQRRRAARAAAIAAALEETGALYAVAQQRPVTTGARAPWRDETEVSW